LCRNLGTKRNAIEITRLNDGIILPNRKTTLSEVITALNEENHKTVDESKNALAIP